MFCLLYFLFSFLWLERLPFDEVFFIESFYLFLIFEIELFKLMTFRHEYIEETINLLMCHWWKYIEPILFFIIINRFTSENKIYELRVLELDFIQNSKCKIITNNLCHWSIIKYGRIVYNLIHFASKNRDALHIWLDFLALFSMICSHMHYIVISLLGFFARLILRRHKPYIIGVTGTVGKTTITTHVAHFLTKQYGIKNVWYSQYHYNGEYGLPLTIIGSKTPWKNPFLWIWVFFLAIIRLFQSYPRYLVLEYGIDHPDEMDFLLSIAIPDIAILTPVEPNHLEQFGTLSNYRNDKIKLIQSARQALVHESLRQYINIDVQYYSLWALSDIDASNIEIDIQGTRAIIHYNHQDFPISLPAIGAFQIENLLPLYPIASILHIDPVHITEYASHSNIESGRSNLLTGINSTTIIDGSYNGGYLSLREGIGSMRSFLSVYWVVFFLGDMRELGNISKELHEKLAKEILDIIPHDAQVAFYLVGPMMQEFAAPILSKKFSVITSLSSQKLGKEIALYLQESPIENIVYAKWSQNTIFIEEWLKFLLKDPTDIQKLPRQSGAWMNKKNIFFKSLGNETI